MAGPLCGHQKTLEIHPKIVFISYWECGIWHIQLSIKPNSAGATINHPTIWVAALISDLCDLKSKPLIHGQWRAVSAERRGRQKLVCAVYLVLTELGPRTSDCCIPSTRYPNQHSIYVYGKVAYTPLWPSRRWQFVQNQSQQQMQCNSD